MPTPEASVQVDVLAIDHVAMVGVDHASRSDQDVDPTYRWLDGLRPSEAELHDSARASWHAIAEEPSLGGGQRRRGRPRGSGPTFTAEYEDFASGDRVAVRGQ